MNNFEVTVEWVFVSSFLGATILLTSLLTMD